MARKKLGEILLAAGVIDATRLRTALLEQQRWGGYLGRILIDMKLISEEVLVQALSQQLNFPAINLDNRNIRQQVLETIPGELAEQHSLVPFNLEGKFLDVAMTDPTNLGIIDELRIRTQLNVRPYLAGPKMIERAIARFYGRGTAVMSMRHAAAGIPDPSVAGDPRVANGVDVIELDGGGGLDDASFGTMTAAQRRAQAFALTDIGDTAPSAAEVANLQQRISHLEALVQRDEDVIRKLLGLLIEKGVASREEILERIK